MDCSFVVVLPPASAFEPSGAEGGKRQRARSQTTNNLCRGCRVSQELSLEKLREMEGRSHENPLQEVAALQYLSGQGHPNVLNCTEVR